MEEQTIDHEDLFAMIAHDIKNPLGVILGYVEVLLERAKEKGLGEEGTILETIRGNALTVYFLATNYLELSRIQAGRLTLAKSSLEINHILSRVGQQYEADARCRHLTLEVCLQDDLPSIKGNPLALERVFTNLVHNALKFTPEMGRVRMISTRQNGEVVAMITDTGPGLAPEEALSIFEKYRRAGAIGDQEGTGLGLFIAKMLVEAQEGRIEVKSTPGRGSCFSVFLPIAKTDQEEP